MVEIDIDTKMLEEYVEKKLGATAKQLKSILVKASINTVAKQIAALEVKQAKKIYTAKKDIGTKSTAFKIKRATTSKLQAILTTKGSNIPLHHFNHRVGKNGISAIINKENGRKKIFKYGNKPFVAFGLGSEENGHPIMVRIPGKYLQNMNSRNSLRFTKHTEALENIKSISRPVMFGNKNTWGKIEHEVEKLIFDDLDRRISKYLK